MERITPEQAYGVGLRVTQALSVAEVSKEATQRALGSNQLGEAVIEVIRLGPEEALQRLQGDQQVYPVTIDYSETIEEMVKAGDYNYANPDITAKHFPVKERGPAEVQIHLFCYNRIMSSEAVLADLDKKGFRPTRPMEHLALGAKYPDLQRQFPIPCLGQSWRDPNGYRRVLYLWRYASYRRLDLYCFEDAWDGVCRFAAVRK